MGYVIKTPSGDSISIILVYSVATTNVLRLLRCEAEVTQMCTPGEDSILIVGTIVGTLALYDLKQLDT